MKRANEIYHNTIESNFYKKVIELIYKDINYKSQNGRFFVEYNYRYDLFWLLSERDIKYSTFKDRVGFYNGVKDPSRAKDELNNLINYLKLYFLHYRFIVNIDHNKKTIKICWDKG